MNRKITENDLYFICCIIEGVARKQTCRNRDVVNQLGREALQHLIRYAHIYHCDPIEETIDMIINEYHIMKGSFFIQNVKHRSKDRLPDIMYMGDLYKRLILDTKSAEENYADGIIRVYNNPICDKIDDYDCSAFYEPSYEIKRAYYNHGF